MVWQKNFVRTKKHGVLELGQDSQRASNCRQLPDQPKPKAVHQGLVPCGRGCCPRSALSVPFLFPFCSPSVCQVFTKCSPSVCQVFAKCLPSVRQVFAKCSPPSFEVNAVARDRHATDVYTSRPKGGPLQPCDSTSRSGLRQLTD